VNAFCFTQKFELFLLKLCVLLWMHFFTQIFELFLRKDFLQCNNMLQCFMLLFYINDIIIFMLHASCFNASCFMLFMIFRHTSTNSTCPSSSLGYLRSHDCNFRSPLMKTLDWSVENWVLITIRLGFVIIYLNQSSQRNLIDIPGCIELTNFN
jgi:hypothetical protein